jgi:TM2 domain-containing membrane protein YozV
MQPFIFDDMRTVIVFTLLFTLGTINCHAEACILTENTASIKQIVIAVTDTGEVHAAIAKDTSRGENQKLIAAVLAFPVPFGMLGMHRIYLGCEPYVPIVYTVTAGGGCGIIPLIDFIYIIAADEQQLREFKENRGVFMWPKK